MNKRKIGIIGCTGSIGTQTLDVIRRNREYFELSFLSAHTDVASLFKLAEEFRPPFVVITGAVPDFKGIADGIKAGALGNNYKPAVLTGVDSIGDLLRCEITELLVAGATGISGLVPVLTALKNSVWVALANKETLVAGGKLVMSEAMKSRTPLIPVDSEHAAVAECLEGKDRRQLKNITLTASGGPFRKYSAERLKSVTAAAALNHPTWKMGKKVTVDSATMMNKGLEIIEAACLFGLEGREIDVVVHPESVIHAIVGFTDNTSVAALSLPDMRIPISRALGAIVGKRLENDSKPLDLPGLKGLTFEPSNEKRFPCLAVAREALLAGGIMPAAMSAADELAVSEFLDGAIGFTDIPVKIARVLDRTKNFEPKSVGDINEADRAARELYKKLT